MARRSAVLDAGMICAPGMRGDLGIETPKAAVRKSVKGRRYILQIYSSPPFSSRLL